MEFERYHPIITFTYLAVMIVFSCIFMHPVYLCVSLMSAISYGVILNGIKKQAKGFIYMLPMAVVMMVLNPLINHEGVTTVCYLPSGNPLTAESISYGIAAAVMITSVIVWFSCYNKIMTSDKFIYLFGRIIPSLSLVLSITLRFVPRFTKRLKEVINAQKTSGKPRLRDGGKILSQMLIWSFESAIVTADSMKSRGYGVEKRTSFSIYQFSVRDTLVLTAAAVFALYIIIGGIFGVTGYAYYPKTEIIHFTPYGMSVLIAYIALAFLPHMIELTEVIRWQFIKSKI